MHFIESVQLNINLNQSITSVFNTFYSKKINVSNIIINSGMYYVT